VSANDLDPADDDLVSSKAWDNTILLRLARYAKPHAQLFYGSFGVLAVLFALDMLGPWIWRHALDGPVRAAVDARAQDPAADVSGSVHAFWIWVAAYLALVLVSVVFRYLEVAQLNRTGQVVIADLRTRLFRHMQTLDLAFFDRRPTGALVTRLTTPLQ
jgi:ABC-type multidrug transport system fused ATPase/permease subunit